MYPMDLETGHEIPIEDPLEVVVEEEVITLETCPEVHTGGPDTFSSNHGNQHFMYGTLHDNQLTINTVESSEPEGIGDSQLSSPAVVDPNCEVDNDWREEGKRLRDKMKKRILRQDKEYRKKECIKSKERMANRRNDPLYREIERQKDRERRAQSRRDKVVREREKERDRLYKKKMRQAYLHNHPTQSSNNHGNHENCGNYDIHANGFVNERLAGDVENQANQDMICVYKITETNRIEIQNSDSVVESDKVETARTSANSSVNRELDCYESILNLSGVSDLSEQCIIIDGVKVKLVTVIDSTESVTNNHENVTNNTESVTNNTESVTNYHENVTNNSESGTNNHENVTNNTESGM